MSFLQQFNKACTTRGGGVLSKQLEYELQLQSICNELVVSYKETDDWGAVAELERTVKEIRSRANHLKQQIALTPNSAASSSYQDINLESQLRKGSPPAFSPATATEHRPGWNSEEPVPGDGAEQLYLSDGNNKVKVNTGNWVPGGVEQPSAAASAAVASGTRRPDTTQTTWKTCNSAAGLDSTDTESTTNKGKWSSTVGLDPANLDSVADCHSVDELDNIEQMMESFMDDFEDLHKQSAEQTSECVVENGLGSEQGSAKAEGLEVPLVNKISRASSESSGQFFSPRESPFRDVSEAEDEEEEREFKDSNGDDEVLWQDCRSSGPKNEVAQFTVSKTSYGTGGDVYYVTLEQEAGCQTLAVGAEFLEPTLRTSDEMITLRDQLSLEADFPFDSAMKGDDLDLSEEFETFLNFVAASPSLRVSPYFVSFLLDGGEVQEEEEEETEVVQGEMDSLVLTGIVTTSFRTGMWFKMSSNLKRFCYVCLFSLKLYKDFNEVKLFSGYG